MYANPHSSTVHHQLVHQRRGVLWAPHRSVKEDAPGAQHPCLLFFLGRHTHAAREGDVSGAGRGGAGRGPGVCTGEVRGLQQLA